jgi:uncharacterized heparinase superfamily protein
VAQRVLSWLAHADVLLQTDDAAHYDAILAVLKADIRRLEQVVRGPVAGTDEAATRWRALIALVQAGLCLDEDGGLQAQAEHQLAAMLADGRAGSGAGSVWRSPDAVASLLVDMETLRRLYRLLGHAVPEFVTAAVERMRRVLGGLMLGDGTLARLGTERSDPEAGLTMALVVRHAGVAATASLLDDVAGFVRLVAEDTCVVADTGATIGARHALQIELSTGDAALLVHDGGGRDEGAGRRGTLVFSGSDGASENKAAVSRMTPTLEPTHRVTADLAGADTQRFDATHAGHGGRGYAHRRRVTLSDGGRHVDGVDELRLLMGGVEATPGSFALRFVLHPSVRVAMGESADRVALTAANGHRWEFCAPGQSVSVEGDVYRDGRGAENTLQILVLADAASRRTVSWTLRREQDGAVVPADDGDAKRAAPKTLAEALAAVTGPFNA